MSRFADRQQLLNEIQGERRKLTGLLEGIPDEDKHVEVVDGTTPTEPRRRAAGRGGRAAAPPRFPRNGR